MEFLPLYFAECVMQLNSDSIKVHIISSLASGSITSFIAALYIISTSTLCMQSNVRLWPNVGPMKTQLYNTQIEQKEVNIGLSSINNVQRF